MSRGGGVVDLVLYEDLLRTHGLFLGSIVSPRGFVSEGRKELLGLGVRSGMAVF